MNDLTLIGKNLFRKPVRTVLLLASIFVAFLILCVLASFDAAVSNLRAAPNRMVTLNKVNFTETLPIAYYGIVAQVDGVAAANRAFIAQFGNIALVIALVVGAAFVAILLIVGTTMALAVRERTREMGVMKTLGFSSFRMLGIVLGESVLLSLLGAMLAVLATPGLLALLAAANGGALRIPLAWPVVGLAFLIALGLGLVTGLAPALGAYRLRIHDALGRR